MLSTKKYEIHTIWMQEKHLRFMYRFTDFSQWKQRIRRVLTRKTESGWADVER